MRSWKLAVLALAVAVSSSIAAVAQSAPKVLRIGSFSGEALSAGEATAIQSLVTSYIVEFGTFRVIDAEGQELALREAETAVQLGVPKDIAPLAADYILSATAQKVGELIVFTMDLTKVSTGEKRNVAEASHSVNDLILALRRLTRSLFGQAQPAGGAEEAHAPQAIPQSPVPAAPLDQSPQPVTATYLSSPTLSLIAGTWSGDKGVDRVSLFRDGRGIAILTSGNSMKVRASVSGSTVVVIQDQPSSAEFYKTTGLDLKAARAVAAKARPWRWVFSLTRDKASLVGTKESVFVKIDAKGEVSVDNKYVREAQWTRMFK